MDTDSQEVLLLLRDGPRIFDPETAPKVLVYHFEEDGNLAADILRINERQKETIEDHGYHGAVFRLYLNVARFEAKKPTSPFVEPRATVVLKESPTSPRMIRRTLSDSAGLALLDETDPAAVAFRRHIEPVMYEYVLGRGGKLKKVAAIGGKGEQDDYVSLRMEVGTLLTVLLFLGEFAYPKSKKLTSLMLELL